MDRKQWVSERRHAAEEGYDKLEGSYSEGPGDEIPPMHHRFVTRLIELSPPGGTILDAACGSGRYLGMVLEAGRIPVGADQSGGMVARAKARHPGVDIEKVGLQELAFEAQFDGVMCIDAMEFVFPEDWPLVLSNLHRTLRPSGHLYMTVEQVEEAELDAAFEFAIERNLPVVRGENLLRGGYHFYPSTTQVSAWVRDVGFAVIKDDKADHGSYGYYHVLMQRI